MFEYYKGFHIVSNDDGDVSINSLKMNIHYSKDDPIEAAKRLIDMIGKITLNNFKKSLNDMLKEDNG